MAEVTERISDVQRVHAVFTRLEKLGVVIAHGSDSRYVQDGQLQLTLPVEIWERLLDMTENNSLEYGVGVT